MRIQKTLCAFVALCLAAAACADGELVQIDLSGLDPSKAIAGTAASGAPGPYSQREAIRAFDGSGVSSDGTCGTVANDAMFMLSSNNSGSFPWYIQVDLGETNRLDGVRLYNFNFAAKDTDGKDCTLRGVRAFELYVSTGVEWMTSAANIKANYTLVLSNQLARASGASSYTGEYFALPAPANARFVALVALDDWDDGKSSLNYNGISEIQLFSGGAPLDPVPGPGPGAVPSETAACAQFSVCCVGDSITEGTHSGHPNTYRTHLADMLAAAGFTNVVWKGSKSSYFAGEELRHEGYSGKNAAEMASIYESFAAEDKADFLLLHAGHNYNVDPDTSSPECMTEAEVIASATNAHRRIIAAARAQNPRTTFLYAKVVTSTKLPKYSYIPALNEAIAALAAELTTSASPVVVVDMADGWDPSEMCLGDKVHPTAEGAARMARKWFDAMFATPFMAGCDALLEAESFAEKGGWVVDPQFADVMGSPYLLAHGRGVPVADASRTVAFASDGIVRAWVRTRDWTPDWNGEKPGRFRLAVGENEYPETLGVAPSEWGWVDAGVVRVSAGEQTVALKDLTGFEGRCDAVYLAPAIATNAPPNDASSLAAWRAGKRGESAAPEDVVEADLVVVGGGIAGTCAAVAAADAGLKVALVQDRPMLGGNASDEVRVRTENEGDEFHWIVKAVRNSVPNGGSMATDDAKRMSFVAGYTNISVHTLWRAYGVVTNAARRIVAVDARHVETGARRRFVAPLYCDATGDGWIGYWAGASYMLGREAKSEFGETTHGRDAADASTMGNSLLWTTRTAAAPSVFPSVPWATKVSGARADTAGGWQWEAGLDPDEDTIYDAEMLRDRLFRAIYGSFSNAKARPGNENLELDFLHYIAGKRESRRIVGDYVVRESDVIRKRKFEDAIGIATWSVDLHRPDGDSGFIAATTHYRYGPWWMPYRSLCCRDVPNLFMAGRCASYTHVAFGSSRVMHAGGQQGVAAGYAAALCLKYGCRPREIYRDAAKTAELQALINKKGEYAWPEQELPYREVSAVVVDNADPSGVTISGTWPSSSYNADRHGDDYLHSNKAASDDLWVRFTPSLPSNATYVVSLFWNGGDSRSGSVPVEIVYDGGVVTNRVNMKVLSDTWNPIGSWPFRKGSSGSVRIMTAGQKNLTVIADAVKFAVVEEASPGEDSDGNGLPDEWERRHFLQTTGTDPDADPDGDGRSNLEEYRAGSNPNDAALPPRLSGIDASDTVDIAISWEGLAGRMYRVYHSGTLELSTFKPLGAAIAGVDGEMTTRLPRGSAPSEFYLIRDESAIDW